MDLHWSEEAFSVPHLLDNIEFPQLLQVLLPKAEPQTSHIKPNHQHVHLNGLTGKSADSPLQDGDILKLHGVKTFKRVIMTGAGPASAQAPAEHVTNQYGYLSPPGSTTIYKQFSVPVSYSVPFQINPFRDLDHVYVTAGDLVKEHPRPSAVVVNKTISLHEKHCVIKEGDVMAITSVDKRCTSTGVVDFLICKHNDKTIGLPMSCVGNFTALQDETLFTLDDLVSKHVNIGLPQKISFHPASKPATRSQCETLARGGEHLIVPDTEYIAENIVKEQYLICTMCDAGADNSLSHTKVYYIPTSCSIARRMRVRLPVFHDINTCKQVLNTRYCPNLSMRVILDATPIGYIGELRIIIKKLSEVYIKDGPVLPPRKEYKHTDAGKILPLNYIA